MNRESQIAAAVKKARGYRQAGVPWDLITRDGQIVAAVKKGESYRQAGAPWHLTRERVRQIVIAAVGAKEAQRWVVERQPPPKPPPAIRICEIPNCDQPVARGRHRYCGERHARVAQITHELITYRQARRKNLARYMLKKNLRPAERRYQEKVLADGTSRPPVIHRTSKWYKLLKKEGLASEVLRGFEIVP